MPDAIPPLPEVEKFAERVRAAIWQAVDGDETSEPGRTERRRVDRDVEGLREHHDEGRAVGSICFACADIWPCDDARRCWDGLCDTGALYGEAP